MREQWIFTKHTCTLAISRSSFAARVAFSSRLRYFLFRNVASSVAFCSTVKTVLLTLWGGMVTESESHRSGRRSKNNRKKKSIRKRVHIRTDATIIIVIINTTSASKTLTCYPILHFGQSWKYYRLQLQTWQNPTTCRIVSSLTEIITSVKP